MADRGEAEQAIAGLNGQNFGGRQIKVNEARPRTDNRGGGGFGGGGGGGRCKISFKGAGANAPTPLKM